MIAGVKTDKKSYIINTPLFVINRLFMKLFTTKNIEIVKYCQEYFGFALPSILWAKRVSKFESSFNLNGTSDLITSLSGMACHPQLSLSTMNISTKF